MSDGYKLKMLVKAVWLASMLVLLAGCAGTCPMLSLGNPQPVQVKDDAGALHTYNYVAIKSGNTLLDHSIGFSLYGEKGEHLLTNTYSNNGILETLGGPLLGTLTPAVNAWQVLK